MRRLLKSLGSLSRDADGSVLAYFAVLMPVALGLVGLVVDVAVWHLNKRVVQSTADMAAVAAALELKRSGRGHALAAANEIAIANGFGRSISAGRTGPDIFRQNRARNLKDRDALTFNVPPSVGPLQKSDDAVEVILTRKVPTFFSSLFIKRPITLAARAVAVGRPTGDCVSGYNASSGKTGDCSNRRPFGGALSAQEPAYGPNEPGTGDCLYETTRQVSLGNGTVLEIGRCSGARVVNSPGGAGYSNRGYAATNGSLDAGYVPANPGKSYGKGPDYPSARPSRGPVRAYLVE